MGDRTKSLIYLNQQQNGSLVRVGDGSIDSYYSLLQQRTHLQWNTTKGNDWESPLHWNGITTQHAFNMVLKFNVKILPWSIEKTWPNFPIKS